MNYGTSRKERTSNLLDPAFIKLDGRTLSQLFEESKAFAKTVVFEEGDVTSDWEAFFEAGSDYLKSLDGQVINPISQKDCPPHLGLFLAFLQLFQSVQQQYNSLSEQHIKFFYQKILGKEAFGMKEDHVYIFFELARNTAKLHLEKGTALIAGKDINKNVILYRTDKAIFLNKAKVVQHHAIFNGKSSNDSIYAYRDISKILPPNNSDETQTGTGWYPFGNRDLLRISAELGFGISAPILDLQEGHRTISINLKTSSQPQQAFLKSKIDASLMEAHLSTADGWMVKPLQRLHREGNMLLIEIILDKQDPPLKAVNPSSEDVFNRLSFPIVKIVLKQGYSYQDYALLQNIHVEEVDVMVKVSGMTALIIKNDYGVLDAEQNIQPFGYTPMVGANLYVHAKEINSKNIDAGTVTLNWKGLPENFKTHYEGYKGETNSLVERKEDFKINLAIKRNKEWINLPSEKGSDFNLFEEHLQYQIPPKEREEQEIANYVKDNGIIRATLTGPTHAFGHGIYPSVYTKAIMAQLQQKDAPIPNPPYTPTVEGIELDYEASYSLDIKVKTVENQDFFHIEPFGINFEVLAQKTIPLISPNYHAGGQLFLGIEELAPPGQLNLFIEIKEANVLDKPDIEIAYLSKNGWTAFSKNQLLSDTTLGLKQTGIITLSFPPNATSETDLMPRGVFWIKLMTKAFPERFDRILSIKTNAIRCTLDTSKIADGHEVNGLAVNSIKSFSEKKGQIKKVEQPYSSFGGAMAESDLEYFGRISERLSHKNRGVSPWDIERLVLQQFPDIYQVICHSHTDEFGVHRAGHMHIIAIPKVNSLEENRIRKPLSSAALLKKIKNYLGAHVSPHAQLSVGNPMYEEVKIHATVSFQDEVDAGFYLAKLEEDIKKYLSPWAYGQDLKIEMGTSFYKSSLIKFIESLPYINFVARVQIDKNNKRVRANEILAGPNAILITSNNHHLKAVEPDTLLCQTNQGIAQMIVDINFQVE